MTKKFTRTIEDFTCEYCLHEVMGDGYTNHCPNCLWSKHVDIHPGDRQATCGGLMEPMRVEHKAGEYTIEHVCQSCGFSRKKMFEKGDNFDALLSIGNSVK